MPDHISVDKGDFFKILQLAFTDGRGQERSVISRSDNSSSTLCFSSCERRENVLAEDTPGSESFERHRGTMLRTNNLNLHQVPHISGHKSY